MKSRPIHTLPETSRRIKTNVCLISASLLVFLTACARNVCAQTVGVVPTNPDQSALLTSQTPLTFTDGTAIGTAINVDDTIHYQQLEGVGASFNDSDAYLVWNKLTPAQRTQLMSRSEERRV